MNAPDAPAAPGAPAPPDIPPAPTEPTPPAAPAPPAAPVAPAPPPAAPAPPEAPVAPAPPPVAPAPPAASATLAGPGPVLPPAPPLPGGPALPGEEPLSMVPGAVLSWTPPQADCATRPAASHRSAQRNGDAQHEDRSKHGDCCIFASGSAVERRLRPAPFLVRHSGPLATPLSTPCAATAQTLGRVGRRLQGTTLPDLPPDATGESPQTLQKKTGSPLSGAARRLDLRQNVGAEAPTLEVTAW